MIPMDRDLTNFRPSKIWRRMPLERRVDAAGLFWDDEHSADQQMEAVAALATHMKFRPRSVITLAPEKRAKYLAQLPTVETPAIEPAVLDAALTDLSVDTLRTPEDVAERLRARDYDVFVLPYGSAFPLAAWPAIRSFIERGGSYAAPLALALLTMRRQASPNTFEGDSQ